MTLALDTGALGLAATATATLPTGRGAITVFAAGLGGGTAVDDRAGFAVEIVDFGAAWGLIGVGDLAGAAFFAACGLAGADTLPAICAVFAAGLAPDFATGLAGTACLATACFAAGFFAGTVCFFTGNCFFAGAFLATDFFAGAFLATGFFAGALAGDFFAAGLLAAVRVDFLAALAAFLTGFFTAT